MTETTEPKEKTLETQNASYKKELIIGSIVALSALAIVAAIVVFIYNSTPKVVYEPAVACDTLSVTEAKELLGDGAFNTNTNNPVLSKNTATSKCGYADGNVDTEKIQVAAVIVRSGVNDEGVQQNKDEFANGIPTQAIEIVKDVGDSAYFNQANGQLNVLKGRNWFVLSYGLGSAPEANTVESVLKLAQKVLN